METYGWSFLTDHSNQVKIGLNITLRSKILRVGIRLSCKPRQRQTKCCKIVKVKLENRWQTNEKKTRQCCDRCPKGTMEDSLGGGVANPSVSSPNEISPSQLARAMSCVRFNYRRLHSCTILKPWT